MKGERKLRLVPPPPAEPAPPYEDLGDEPPITEEEMAAAEALRSALDRGEDPAAEALRAAFSPGTLDEEDLDAIVKRALGDEASVTRAERAAADRLRAELEGTAEVRVSAPLHALRLAARPTEIAPERNEMLIAAAFRRARGRMAAVRRIAPVTMAALAGVAALAAGVALFVGKAGAPPPGAATAALVHARSADDLFDPATPFPRTGEESARIDRIAGARARDLRKNRFTAWGVR
jgi:hypothetical protein